MRSKGSLTAVAVLVFLVACATPLSAQPAKPDDPERLGPSLELFGGGVAALSEIEGTTGRAYSRPYTYYDWYQSGYRWISVKRDAIFTSSLNMPYQIRRRGLDVGANVFLTPHLGIQGRYALYRGVISGPDTEIRGSDHVGQVVIPWRGLDGSDRRHILSFNPVIRGRLGRRLAWYASAGASYMLMRLEYGDYGDWYREGVTELARTNPTTTRLHGSVSSWGANAGVSLAYRFASRGALMVDVRYFSGSGREISAPRSLVIPAHLSHARLFVGLNALAWRKKPVDIVEGWRAR